MKTIVQLLILAGFMGIIIAITIVYMFINLYSTSSVKINQDKGSIVELISKVNYNSKWDSSEQYRVTDHLAKPDLMLDKNDITLVTQCSHHNLFRLINLIYVWQGPLSIAVFSKASDVLHVITQIAMLRQCYQGIMDYVTFHLVTLEGSGNLKYSSMDLLNCSIVKEPALEASHNYDLSVAYPVNVMRNVARKGVSSKYLLLIDMDMLPSLGLRHSFNSLARSSVLSNKTVFIVPAFELAHHVPAPETRAEVKTLVQRDIMRPFYAELCPKCQSCVDYSAWLNLPNRTGLSVAYSADWSDPCEPFYIARSDVPLYDESFKQYGFNRISQVCELHVAGFFFSVLDNAFLSHLGMKTKESFHRNKEAEQEGNRKRFREFKQSLKFKYPTSSRHC